LLLLLAGMFLGGLFFDLSCEIMEECRGIHPVKNMFLTLGSTIKHKQGVLWVVESVCPI